jgi:hypothetical protein
MEELLKKAIDRELVKNTSPNFTDKVMNSIVQLTPVAEYRPIISKKGWVIIGLVALAIAVYVIGLPMTAEGSHFLDFVSKISTFFDSIKVEQVSLFSNVNMLVILGGSIAVFLLLLFENMLFKKKFKQ